MRNRRLFILIGVMSAAAAFMQSCNVAYLPSQQNVPLIRNKEDESFTASPSNFQLAAPVSKSLAVMANLQYSFFKTRTSDEEKGGVFIHRPYQWNFEIGTGYYNEFSPGFVFELYGGTGIGGSNVFADTADYFYHGNHYRFFLQPDIGYKRDKFSIALSSRLQRLQFFNEFADNLSVAWQKDHDVYNLDKQAFLFIEPALTLKFKVTDDIDAFSQFLYSYKITNEPINRMEGTIILGISARF